MQKFADEHALDKLEIISSSEVPLKAKINTLGWLARYSDFVSLSVIT